MIWKIRYQIFNDPIFIDMTPTILVAAATIEKAIECGKYDSKYIVYVEKLGVLINK